MNINFNIGVGTRGKGGGAFSPPISQVCGGDELCFSPQHLGNTAT